jgi:Mg-chelatase subunit ChlD
VVSAPDPEGAPTRKVRKTKAAEEPPQRATRKSKAKKATPSNWEDLFTGSDSANYTRSLGLTKEAITSGDDDRTLLRALQTEGWSAKQSRWILDDALNS